MKGSTVVFMCLIAVAISQDPRTRENSQCMANNNRICASNQICVERKDGSNPTLNMCVNRIARGVACMASEASMRPENVNPMRRSAMGASDRDVASTIQGRMMIGCSNNLQCRNRTCQTILDTTCNSQRIANRQIRCNAEDGMFEVRQCRRLTNETSTSITPTAAICGCANRMTGTQSMTRVVRTTDERPECGRMCQVMQNRRNVSVRHDESITRPVREQCERCMCNDGMLEECAMLAGVNCSAGRGQATCRSNNRDLMDGEARSDGTCNRCRCTDGRIRCTNIPGCRPNNTNQARDEDNERAASNCEACNDMEVSHVCVPRDGRTFKTRCHAMRCANAARGDIVDGPCRDNNACTRDECPPNEVCFRTGSKTQMSSMMDRPDARRTCVNRNNLNCATTSTSTSRDGRMQRTVFEAVKDVTDFLPRSKDNRNDRQEDQVVCEQSGETFPSTCHMLLEKDGSDYQVRHPGQCRGIDSSEMVCGTDGVTYRNMDIMNTQGGNVRMDYRGACQNVTGSMRNTARNRCEMARKNDRCTKLTDCTRRTNSTDGCCQICGSTLMLAMNQDRVENQANNFGDIDTFMAHMFRNRTGGKAPVIPPEAVKMCNVSITKPGITGNVTEIEFRARNMKDGMGCHRHAMNAAEMLNRAGDNSNVEPITVAESMVAAAAVAPEATEVVSDGSIPFVASPIIMLLGLLLAKVFLY